MDDIFKALNDPARRALLDSLRRNDGQTLTELEAQLDMTRFGVMKHLKVLEDAHLVITRKRGRFKHHYLNAVPLQEAIDRWIEPFRAKPTARAVIELKSKLESETHMPADTPDLISSIYINCSHDALWDALTKSDIVGQYHFATPHIDGDYTDGATVVLRNGEGGAMLTQTVTRLDPKSLIETTFELPRPDMPASRCRYLVEPAGDGMKLTVEHYDLPPEMTHTRDGWSRFLSSIKSHLEGGDPRPFAIPLS